MTTTNLPFAAKSPWFVKGICLLAGFVMALVSFWPPEFPIFKMWADGSWVYRLQIVVVGCLIPIGILDAFFRKAVLDSEGIRSTSRYGTTKFHRYSEIERLECGPDSLKIIFSDGWKIKVWRVEANLRDVMQIINTHSAKQVPVKFR